MEFYRARDVSNSTGYLAFIGRTQMDLASACSAVADRSMPPPAAATRRGVYGEEQKIRCAVAGTLDVRLVPFTQRTTRVVRKVIFVRVKGKRVRRVVRRRVTKVIRLGTDAMATVAGIPDTLVHVRIFISPTARSYVLWDTRHCGPVGLTE